MNGKFKLVINEIKKYILWRWHKIKYRNPVWYHHNNVKIRVLPSVFHPGIFHSSITLLEYLQASPVENRKILELGAGSGLIAISMAKRGAKVSASDINPNAIRALKESMESNNVFMSLFQSDVFQNIPPDTYDFILVNPPYFNKNPKDMWDQAFYCGKNFEFFDRFFRDLLQYIDPGSTVLMILNEHCELKTIEKIALNFGFQMVLKSKIKKSSEDQLIYSIHSINH